MNTNIINVKGNWADVLDNCRSTVGKESFRLNPSVEWRRSILIAEHSPIRCISFEWRWRDIKSWIATHWSRHKWECFIRTQRSDRTGIDRDKLPQDALVTFTGEANIQHLIDTMRKRLCYQASEETRLYAEDLKRAITKIDAEIGNVLVPNCIYRNGCPEMGCCPRWAEFVKHCRDNADQHPGLMSIPQRYSWYNAWLGKERGWAEQH